MSVDLIKRVLAPLSAIVIMMMGNAFFVSFVSLHLTELGYQESVVGLLHSLYYGGMLLGAMAVERLIARVGHIRAYAAFCAVGTACIIALGLSADIYVWAFARFGLGFCVAMYFVIVESWFLSESTEETRGTILSLYMIALYVSQAASQFILPMLDLSSLEPYFWSALLIVLSQVPLTLTLSPAPHIHEGSRQTLRRLARRSPFGFTGCLIAGLILSALYSFVPVYAQEQGLSVSALLSTCILGGVILQWPLGRLSDIVDRRQILLGVAITTSIPCLGILAFGSSEQLIYTLMFLLGGLAFTLYPLSITQVCDRLQSSDITKATGVLLVVYGIGAMLGPLASSFFVDQLSSGGLYVYVIVNSVALAGFGLWSILFRPGVPLEDQNDFVSIAATTPLAVELDPRAPELEEE